MTDEELNARLDKIEKAAEDNDGCGCSTIVIIGILLYIVYLLGGYP